MARRFLSGEPQRLEAEEAVAASVPFSVSLLFYPSQWGNVPTWFALGSSSSPWEAFALRARDDRTLQAWASSAAAADDETGRTQNAWTLETWQHACGVFAADRRTAILEGRMAEAGTSVQPIVPTALDRTALGALVGLTASAFAAGGLAEVALWDAALDEAEIAALARRVSPLAVRPGRLRAYWPLGGRFVASDRDLRGGHDLTPCNGPLWMRHPPTFSPLAPRLGATTPRAPVAPLALAAGEATVAGAIEGEISTAGAVAGQTHG